MISNVRKPGHVRRSLIVAAVVALGIVVVAAWPSAPSPAADSQRASDSAGQGQVSGSPAAYVRVTRSSYATLATRSIQLLETSFYNGTGLWHMCLPVICNTKNRDWGADVLTDLLYFRWMLDRDPSVVPLMRSLAQTAHLWLPGQVGSSDGVTWDAVAEVRLYQLTGEKIALTKAEAALKFVDTEPGLATGACPSIEYQWPYGQRGQLKTIETTSNYIKAALLLYGITGKRMYLTQAITQYGQVRKYFFNRKVSLYSSYLFDTGRRCTLLPGQYFASVNGNMIWAGSMLAQITGKRSYLRNALTTAHAVNGRLSDGDRVFADLQADNDIVEPLIEAMYRLATVDHVTFATKWLLRNASAAGADGNSDGEFGRFFDGPPPTSLATAWQINGGIALMLAAAALDPRGKPADPGFWDQANFVIDSQTLTRKPVQISFTGRAIAIIGTIGDKCCLYGHAAVFVDGKQTVNRAGIWQNYSSPSRVQPDQVLFAWRWKTAGHHVITIRPAPYDNTEGGSFFSMSGYLLVG